LRLHPLPMLSETVRRRPGRNLDRIRSGEPTWFLGLAAGYVESRAWPVRLRSFRANPDSSG